MISCIEILNRKTCSWISNHFNIAFVTFGIATGRSSFVILGLQGRCLRKEAIWLIMSLHAGKSKKLAMRSDIDKVPSAWVAIELDYLREGSWYVGDWLYYGWTDGWSAAFSRRKRVWSALCHPKSPRTARAGAYGDVPETSKVFRNSFPGVPEAWDAWKEVFGEIVEESVVFYKEYIEDGHKGASYCR